MTGAQLCPRTESARRSASPIRPACKARHAGRAGHQTVAALGPRPSLRDPSMSVLPAGARVPSFALAKEDGEKLTQEDLLGHTSIFVFYPFAFSPVCTDQLQIYERVLDQLTANGEQIYGVSCDSTWAQQAFKDEARRLDPAALGLRAQGRRLRGLRRAARGRLSPAGARDRQPRRCRALELSGALSRRAPSAELLLEGLSPPEGRCAAGCRAPSVR